MKARLCLLLLAALFIVPLAAQAQETTWAGNYYTSGVDDEGVAYESGLEIVETDGPVMLTWTYADEADVEIGVGLPLSDTQLAVAYDVSCIMQIFNVADDGTLSGPWAEAFVGLGEETSTPSDGQGATVGGMYTVEGMAPDGAPYSGTLEITATGDTTYDLMWSLEDFGEFGGVGMMANGVLISGATVDPEIECGAGLLEIGEDGTITAMWADEGAEATYSDVSTPITLADSFTIEGTDVDGSEWDAELNITGGSGSRYLFDFIVGGDAAVPGLLLLRGNVVNMVWGGEQCAVLNRALLENGSLWTRNSTIANETVGMTLQTPVDETDGFTGTFDLAGTAATGATTTGTTTISGGENGVYASAGEATRSTGETVNLDGVFIAQGGVLVGTYAPGGDVTPCGVVAGSIDANGVITAAYTQYGETDLIGTQVLTPTM